MTELLREDFTTAPEGRAPNTSPAGWVWVSGDTMPVSGGATSSAGIMRKFSEDAGVATGVNRIRFGVRHDTAVSTGYGPNGGVVSMYLSVFDSTASTDQFCYADLTLEIQNGAEPFGPYTFVGVAAEVATTFPAPPSWSEYVDYNAPGYLVSTTGTFSEVVLDFSGSVIVASVDGVVAVTFPSSPTGGANLLNIDEVQFRTDASAGLYVDYIVLESYVPPPPPPPPPPGLFWTDHIGTIETIKTETP